MSSTIGTITFGQNMFTKTEQDFYNQFPDPKDNPIIWCERCNRYHEKYTATRSRMKEIIHKSALKLAGTTDEQLEKELFNEKDS